jgi:alpha-mannosidase
VLRNDRLEVVIDADGLFSSVRDLVAERELIPAGTRGNLLQLHRDIPNQWDAWDIDASYRRSGTDLTAVDTVEILGLERVRIVRSFGASRITQEICLAQGSAAVDLTFTIDWHERQKLLKLAFPIDVQAERAASEIQFGHVFRATHTNTSWDAARYETVAHRWVHVGEPGYGVAVANDSTYGHDISRTTDAAGRPATTVRLSLLRAPRYPDPEADQGEHVLRVSLRPGATIADAIEEGYRLNVPVRTVTGAGAGAGMDTSVGAGSGGPIADRLGPLFEVDNPAVVIEAVKLAEDRSGDVIVRIYEAHGSRSRARVIRRFEATEAQETDLLERPLTNGRAALTADGAATVLELRPFQLVTLRFARR